MAKRFTLGRTERLKSRKLIDQLFGQGKRLPVYPYLVFYQFIPAGNESAGRKLQFGAGAGTRHFKKSVERNRIKRLTREAWRTQKMAIESVMEQHPLRLIVFLIYTGKELPAFAFVEEKTGIIIQKLITLANENRALAS